MSRYGGPRSGILFERLLMTEVQRARISALGLLGLAIAGLLAGRGSEGWAPEGNRSHPLPGGNGIKGV